MAATASVIGVETCPAALARRDDRAGFQIDAIPRDQRLGQSLRKPEPRLKVLAKGEVKSLRLAGVKLAHALDRLFEAVRPPKRLARKLVAPDYARPDEKLAQRFDNAAVDRRRGDRLLALALDGVPASPSNQTSNVGVRDLI